MTKPRNNPGRPLVERKRLSLLRIPASRPALLHGSVGPARRYAETV